MEAARRYAALLEGAGRYAAAASALVAVAGASAARWGTRSAAHGSLLSQLAQLQALQGLHRSAEFTWRQVSVRPSPCCASFPSS